jgi:dTDP-4-dehydrorhamnose 3,5-epimerase
MEGVEIREIHLHEDERGWLGEIIRDDETRHKPLMTYLSMTHPGMVRGPHEHRHQSDYFCFIGRFRLYLWDNRKASATFGKHKVVETKDVPTAAFIPPGIAHAYKNIDDKSGIVINLPDRLYKGRGKEEPVDEIRYENNPDSAYRIED